MGLPRLSIAWSMVGVALVALNLAAIRALADGFQEQLLFDALPTLNLMALAAIIGRHRRRLRPYALGFVVAGSFSLLAYQIWAENHPWECLRYFQPLSDIAVRIRDAYPHSHMPIVYTMLIVVFAVPHSIVGIVGGCLTAKGWEIMARRKQG
jgi:hypothetical protein